MKATPLKLLMLFLLVSFGTVPARAQGHPHGRPGDGPARREIRTYIEANVQPVLQQQRQKLEPQLTAADRTQLATYRTQLRALKEQGQALRRNARPDGTTAPASRPSFSEEQRQQAHELRSQARGIMLSVAQLAQKYDGAIAQLAQEVQPQKEKWAADIQALVAKNATPEQQQRLAGFHGRRREHGPLRRFFRPALFLLMDPGAPASGPANRSLGNTSFYPNPAAPTSQLTYDVKKAGPVTIDLLDKNGNKLRTLATEAAAETGSHTQVLDLRDLPAGTYFYKITTKSGSETKRFVKE